MEKCIKILFVQYTLLCFFYSIAYIMFACPLNCHFIDGEWILKKTFEIYDQVAFCHAKLTSGLFFIVHVWVWVQFKSTCRFLCCLMVSHTLCVLKSESKVSVSVVSRQVNGWERLFMPRSWSCCSRRRLWERGDRKSASSVNTNYCLCTVFVHVYSVF